MPMPGPDDHPPPVQSGPAKAFIFGGAGAIVALVLLVVVISIEPEVPGPREVAAIDDVTELIPPAQLSDADLADGDLDLPRGMEFEAPQGGWVQVVNQRGELAQQYRCESLDPNPPGMPPGWVKMDRPRGEIFLSNHRVLSLSGDTALAHRREGVLEEGTLIGNVLIRLFEMQDGRPIDTQRDRPVLVVRTAEARLDNFLGKISCEGDIHIETRSVEFPGRGLSALIDDQNEQIRLSIDEVDFIRIASLGQTRASRPPRPTSASPPPTADEPAPAPEPVAADTAPPPTPAPTQAPTPAPTESADPQFYRLTLHDEVRVRRGDEATGQTASGDTLTIVFSLQSEGLGDSLAASWPRPAPERGPAGPAQPVRLADTFAVLAVAAARPQEGTEPQPPARIAPLPAPQDIYIRCRGGLTMVPVSDPAEYPASIDDARLQLTGRPVRLHDARRQTDATCDRLLYHARDRKLELIGSPDFPLRFDSPRGRGGGRLFWLRDTPGGAIGGFEGSGWLTAANETPDRPPSPVAEAAFPPPWPNTPPPRPVAPVEADGKPAEAATPLERLRIVWEKGVDLEFDEPDQPGGTTHLRRVRFDGNVRVHSEEGTIACDNLDLLLATNDEGKSIPTTMTATGQVRAADPERTIWADVLVVEFRERRAAAAEPDEEGAYRDPMGGDAEVERMTAEGDVQVLLANGARAFAQKLIGDVPGETIELLGSNVVIAYDKMIIDRGRRVVLRRQTDTAHWDGPGQARFFSTPLETAAEGRIERPDVIGKPDVRARWNTSMLYDNTFNEGAGSIDLRGEVDAKSEPSPLERNTVNADALTLEFVNVPRADGGDEGHPPPAGATLSPDNVERVLGRFIARGEAKLENRTWLTAEHLDKPRVFYIAGDHVEYDDQTGEALVVGAGELLIRDLTEDDAAGGSAPFGPKGTTLFRWKKKLHMTRGLDDRFDIVLAGEVEALHQGLDDETATLSCDRLEATVVRPGATGKRGALDLEGPAKLKRLRAWDGVFIRTQTRDVDCDEFDYNATTGLAQVRARPGRRVSILTRGTAHPIHAQHALWNMSNDRVTITRGSGTDSN